MKQKSLLLYRYSVPFRTPFHYANGSIDKREGFLIGSGKSIWTEIAPLPGFSGESMEDAGSFLKNNWNLILQHFKNATLDRFLVEEAQQSGIEQFPSIRFGLSLLDEQQKASASGLPLFAYWQEQWFPDAAETKGYVRCNALAEHQNMEELLQVIHFRKESGFRTMKVKLTADPETAYNVINETCTRFPDVIFRYDANRAFSLQEALGLFERLRSRFDRDQTGNNLQYIEEPLSNPDVDSLTKLKKFGISIAADESARSSAEVRKLNESGSFDYLVIKPMLFGSFNELKELIQSDSSVTISSVFETAVGRMLLAHLAALFNNNRETDHGLATGPFLMDDVSTSMPGPHIKLKSKPGIGLKVNMDKTWLTPEVDSSNKE